MELYVLTVIVALFISFVVSGFEMIYVRIFPFFPKFSGYLHDRSGILTTVLIWNIFALTVGTIYIYKIVETFLPSHAIFISGILSTLIFAVLGDLLPKIISLKATNAMFGILVYPFIPMYLLLKFLGIAKLASFIVESKYSRDEILNLTLASFKDHLDEKDINFIKVVISALNMPARLFVINGGNVSEKISENATCLDAMIFMRKKGISKVRIGEEGVFDLHEFINRISQEHL